MVVWTAASGIHREGDKSDADLSISAHIGTAFFNLFTIDRCCHRKYSFLKTFLMLFLFSAVLFGISYTFAEELSFQGDGSLSLYGLVFLIPFPSRLRVCWNPAEGFLSGPSRIFCIF